MYYICTTVLFVILLSFDIRYIHRPARCIGNFGTSLSYLCAFQMVFNFIFYFVAMTATCLLITDVEKFDYCLNANDDNSRNLNSAIMD